MLSQSCFTSGIFLKRSDSRVVLKVVVTEEVVGFCVWESECEWVSECDADFHTDCNQSQTWTFKVIRGLLKYRIYQYEWVWLQMVGVRNTNRSMLNVWVFICLSHILTLKVPTNCYVMIKSCFVFYCAIVFVFCIRFVFYTSGRKYFLLVHK